MALSADQLALLDETREVRIDTRGSTTTIIWIVVANDEVYVRSVQGENGRWYQRAVANPRVDILVGDDRIGFEAVHVDDVETIEAVTHAFRAKYPRSGSLDPMTREEVLNTTLRLDPVS